MLGSESIAKGEYGNESDWSSQFFHFNEMKTLYLQSNRLN